jgi:hypothetical protein
MAEQDTRMTAHKRCRVGKFIQLIEFINPIRAVIRQWLPAVFVFVDTVNSKPQMKQKVI